MLSSDWLNVSFPLHGTYPKAMALAAATVCPTPPGRKGGEGGKYMVIANTSLKG